MNQEILKAYKALKIKDPREVKNLDELENEIDRIKKAWRELMKDYHGDSARVVGSDILSAQINNAYDRLKDYFEELKQTLPEQNQEIVQETTVENEPKEAVEEAKSVYPKHDETVKEWNPEEFEIKKARETYEDNTGFEKGFGFDKRV